MCYIMWGLPVLLLQCCIYSNKKCRSQWISCLSLLPKILFYRVQAVLSILPPSLFQHVTSDSVLTNVCPGFFTLSHIFCSSKVKNCAFSSIRHAWCDENQNKINPFKHICALEMLNTFVVWYFLSKWPSAFISKLPQPYREILSLMVFSQKEADWYDGNIFSRCLYREKINGSHMSDSQERYIFSPSFWIS